MNMFEAGAGPDVGESEKYKKDLPMILVTVPHDEEKPNTTGWENNYPNFKFRSEFQLTNTWLSSQLMRISYHFSDSTIFLTLSG